MSTRTVARKATAPKKDERLESYGSRLLAFLNLKTQTAMAESHQKGLRDDLAGDVEELGYKDDKGSFWLDLPEPIEADTWDEDDERVVRKVFRKVKLQRRAASKLDPDVAEKLLAKKPGEAKGSTLLEECQVQITVLDEEAIQRALFEGKITKAEFNRIYPTTVTYAFMPQGKAK